MLTMVLFAGSCVGLLLYLWISFGGTVPFAPAGYRFSVEFSQATELGTQAQVAHLRRDGRPRGQRGP